MPIPEIPPDSLNFNNPSKEIFAASGIYETNQIIGNPPFYADDLPGFAPNTGIKPVNTIAQPLTTNALFSADLSRSNRFIDDMIIFNDYIHYGQPSIRFNPEFFLQQSVVSFNMYNLENRP